MKRKSLINAVFYYYYGERSVWKLQIKHLLCFLQGSSSKRITLGLGKMLAVNIYKFDKCTACHNPRRMEGEQRGIILHLKSWPALLFFTQLSSLSFANLIPPSVYRQSTEESTKYCLVHSSCQMIGIHLSLVGFPPEADPMIKQ